MASLVSPPPLNARMAMLKALDMGKPWSTRRSTTSLNESPATTRSTATTRAPRATAMARMSGCSPETLADEIAQQREFVGRSSAAGATDALYIAWRDTATSRLATARRDAEAADAVCTALREALADTLRTARGFETLLARHEAERARLAARRDPLLALMSLRRGGAG